MEIINRLRRKRVEILEEPPDEENRKKGSIAFWSREVKREVKLVYCKVVIDRDNLTLDTNSRAQVVRTLRAIADDIENEVPAHEVETTPKGHAVWKRDTKGDKIGWYQYEEA